MRTHCFGGKNIIEAHVPGWEEWVPRLLGELEASRSRIETSHRIGGRWENSYLPIELVPSVRSPMRFARDLGKGELNLSPVILFKPSPLSANAHPPFWFNLSFPGEETGLHDHARDSLLSAVAYLACVEDSGNLFFRTQGESDLEVVPEVGKIVLFDPSIKHGVRRNESSFERVSLAFNLFPFPLPTDGI